MTRFLLLLAASSPCAAEMYGAEYQSCSNGTTAAIVECVQQRAKEWDARLNADYRAAMARADPGQREPLKQAQRAWIGYRDANCRAHGAREGSISQIESAECVRSMTEDRAKELSQFAAGEESAP